MATLAYSLATLLIYTGVCFEASAQGNEKLPLYEGKSIQDWLAASKSQDSKVRSEAHRVLTEVAIPELVTRSRSHDKGARWSALADLGRLGTKAAQAVPAITFALHDVDEFVRVTAATSLKKIAPENMAGLPILVKSLGIGDECFRCLVGGVFIDHFGEEAVQPLLDALPDVDSRGKEWTVGTLACMEKRALPLLEKNLSHRNLAIRTGVEEALRQMVQFADDPVARAEASRILRKDKKNS